MEIHKSSGRCGSATKRELPLQDTSSPGNVRCCTTMRWTTSNRQLEPHIPIHGDGAVQCLSGAFAELQTILAKEHSARLRLSIHQPAADTHQSKSNTTVAAKSVDVRTTRWPVRVDGTHPRGRVTDATGPRLAARSSSTTPPAHAAAANACDTHALPTGRSFDLGVRHHT